MKISKERLMEIIRHELKELDSSKIGGERVSKTQQAASLRDKVKNINDTNDIDNLERGIIQQFTKGLEDLAKVSNLNSGMYILTRENNKTNSIYYFLKQE